MKIRKVKYHDHPILGNMELDFVNPATDHAYDYIILLGENGTGKTTILNTISGFLNCVSIKPFAYIEYDANGTIYKAEPLQSGNPSFYSRTRLSDSLTEKIQRDKNVDYSIMCNDTEDPRSYPCVVSKARADYITKKITSSTTITLDTEKHEDDSKDDYTSLKQLLVDIANQDNQAFVEFNQKQKNNRDYVDFEPTSKMYRFKSAFNGFFSQMSFKKVVDKTDEKAILFEKNGSEISIDALSTGEKQIVYRGAFLLKNSGNMDGGTVFIDEPELSMHPLWERKILQYFKDLYMVQSSNDSKAQLFFASHSDAVVADAINDRDKHLIIVLNNQNKSITATPITSPMTLPTITTAEVNYLAFGIYSVDYHIALYGYLQTLTECGGVKALDDYIAEHSLYNKEKYEKPSSYKDKKYHSLSTLIRNKIDHPDNKYTYNHEDLKISTEFLIQLINDYKKTKSSSSRR